MGINVFSVPVFFIVFRETIETGIVVAVLLSFIKQTLSNPVTDAVIHKRLVRQVWFGTGLGLLLCLIIGGGMLGAFYSYGKDIWGATENLYEAIFSLIASVIITIMGIAMLRVSKMQEKWQVKIQAALETSNTQIGWGGWRSYGKKYAMFLLPFITVLREGLEGVIFVGGVGVNEPATAFPLPVFTGIAAGSIIGIFIYRGGNTVKLQWFLVASTCVLYLVAAGLLSKSAWFFDMYAFERLVGGSVAESGDGPGSYNIHHSVWHVNCCSPTLNGGSGWGIFNAILGWQNSATYSSVIAYNLYWIIVSTWFVMLWYEEKNGHFMFSKAKTPKLIAPLETRDEVLIGEGSYVDEDNMARNNGASSSSLAKPRADVATEELVKLGST